MRGRGPSADRSKMVSGRIFRGLLWLVLIEIGWRAYRLFIIFSQIRHREMRAVWCGIEFDGILTEP